MRNPLAADIVIPFIQRHRAKLTLAWIGIPILTIAMYVFGPIAERIYWIYTEPFRRVAFESEKWKDQSSIHSDESVRLRMIDNLLKRYDFRTVSKDEVIALLGAPTRTRMFAEGDLVYLLGPERNLISIDSEWLDFSFDEQAHVTSWKVTTD